MSNRNTPVARTLARYADLLDEYIIRFNLASCAAIAGGQPVSPWILLEGAELLEEIEFLLSHDEETPESKRIAVLIPRIRILISGSLANAKSHY